MKQARGGPGKTLASSPPGPLFNFCFERAWYAITRDPRHDLIGHGHCTDHNDLRPCVGPKSIVVQCLANDC